MIGLVLIVLGVVFWFVPFLCLISFIMVPVGFILMVVGLVMTPAASQPQQVIYQQPAYAPPQQAAPEKGEMETGCKYCGKHSVGQFCSFCGKQKFD